MNPPLKIPTNSPLLSKGLPDRRADPTPHPARWCPSNAPGPRNRVVGAMGAQRKHYYEWSYDISIHGYIMMYLACSVICWATHRVIRYFTWHRWATVWTDSPLHKETLNQWPKLVRDPWTDMWDPQIRYHIPCIPCEFSELSKTWKLSALPRQLLGGGLQDTSQTVATWCNLDSQNRSTTATSAGGTFQECSSSPNIHGTS